MVWESTEKNSGRVTMQLESSKEGARQGVRFCLNNRPVNQGEMTV